MKDTSFFNSRPAWISTLVFLLLLGFAIRLYDLTDLPLDFHPTRQLLSALKARGMYYETLTNIPTEQKSFAIQQWKVRAAIEPEIIENIVAFTYRFTGEKLWIAKIYSSLFWVIGAFFLFLLAREITSIDGALASTAVYLFLPYAVIASRSFQPDPLMVMLIIIFWWAVYQWSNLLTAKNAKNAKEKNLSDLRALSGSNIVWLFAILAGLFGGLAIYIKFVAAFFVIAGGLGALLGRMSLRDVLKQPTVYVMSVLGILPAAAYTIYGVFIAGYLGQQFSGRFIPALFLSPSYYLGWLGMLNIVIGGFVLMIALLAFFFVDEKNRRFILALWLGYFIFGIYFNYHISSHDYYSLPLIPIVALSIAPLADFIFSALLKPPSSAAGTLPKAYKLIITLILLLGLSAHTWNIRSEMKSIDYRPQEKMWQEIGEITRGYNLAGLTQDYGSRLAYWGWVSVTPWQTSGDVIYHNDLRGSQGDFEKDFETLTLKKDLFIVTDFEELKRQPFLKTKLSEYPIFAQGDGYIIYSITVTH